ncbi:MAG: ribonuclease Z [Bacteroidales bacterium]|nr:ribonuclease Z [Bacteroidales bacterium]
MSFSITVLGSSAAVPTKKRWLSSQVLACEQSLFLIDCGEGAQYRMQQFDIKRHRIQHIFISHLHGDHFFGLVGLLNSLNLNQREVSMHIYAPEPLKNYLEHTFLLSETRLFYPLIFHDLQPIENQLIFENESMTVHSLPLIHSIPTFGFIFREKQKKRNIRHDFVETFHPDFDTIKNIKNGADFVTNDGKIIQNQLITTSSGQPHSYAYFADTQINLNYQPFLSNIDILYHEATFSDAETDLAEQRGHSTARQAATLAKAAHVKKLLLGHISSRFIDDESILEQEAQSIFPDSELVEDGRIYHTANLYSPLNKK